MKPYKLFSYFSKNTDDSDSQLSVTSQEEYLEDLQFSLEQTKLTDHIYGGIAGSVPFPQLAPPKKSPKNLLLQLVFPRRNQTGQMPYSPYWINPRRLFPCN